MTDHLRQRSLLPSEAEGAGRLLGEALEQVQSAAWVQLEWEGAQPVLTLHPTDDQSVLDVVEAGGASSISGGIWAVDEGAADLADRLNSSPAVRMTLPIRRGAEADIDLMPDRAAASAGHNLLGCVTSALVGQLDAGSTMPEAAAVAGATAAQLAGEAFAEQHDGNSPVTATDVAEAFIALHNSSGSDFFLLSSSDRRAVLGNRTCPFGPGVANREVLCRTTSAMLGSLAARANGRAVVSVDEAIATGDHRCRAVVDFDEPSTRWNHAYQWPPAGPAGNPDLAVTRGFRVGLSLRLPRDQLSVPLIRHMVGHALAEVGARPDDISDLEIAVTEATTNVIKHSAHGDAYDVEITIGPELVELRVVDVGRGFDSEAIQQLVARPDDESGRGVALMHALVDQARLVSAPERGTMVHLMKRLRFDEQSPARRLMLSALADIDLDSAEEDEPGVGRADPD